MTEVRQKIPQKAKNGNPLVMVVGMCGAGKSVVAKHLKRKGWNLVHFGEITIRELDSRNLEDSETNERVIREQLRKMHGSDVYAKLSFPKIKNALGDGPTVIDGLYSWAEYKYLRENLQNKIYILAVFTTRSLRYQRLANRCVRSLSPELAEMRDFAEIEKLEKGGPIAIADYVILNDGSEEELRLAVDKVLTGHILPNRGHEGFDREGD